MSIHPVFISYEFRDLSEGIKTGVSVQASLVVRFECRISKTVFLKVENLRCEDACERPIRLKIERLRNYQI